MTVSSLASDSRRQRHAVIDLSQRQVAADRPQLNRVTELVGLQEEPLPIRLARVALDSTTDDYYTRREGKERVANALGDTAGRIRV